jgi:hypothetical protein
MFNIRLLLSAIFALCALVGTQAWASKEVQRFDLSTPTSYQSTPYQSADGDWGGPSYDFKAEEKRRQEEADRKRRQCVVAFQEAGYGELQKKMNLCDRYQIQGVVRSSDDKASYGPSREEYFSCLKRFMPVVAKVASFVDDCADSWRFRPLMSRRFNGCWSALQNKLGLAEADLYSQCSSESTANAVDTSSFAGCVDMLKPSGYSTQQMLDKCTSSSASSIASPDFARCRERVMGHHVNSNDALQICHESKKQDGVNARSFEGCLATLALFGSRGVGASALCADVNLAEKLEDDSARDCLGAMAKATFRNYIHYAAFHEGMSGGPKVISNALRECKSTSNSSLKTSPYLKLIGETNIHTDERFLSTPTKEDGEVRVGGISALSFDEKSNMLYMMSDANPENSAPDSRPNRIYKMEMKLTAGGFSLADRGFVYLLAPKKSTLALDLEGMARLANGNIILSAEMQSYHKQGAPRGLRFINVFDAAGNWLRGVDVPDAYMPASEIKTGGDAPRQRRRFDFDAPPHGFKFNKGFEALSLSPSQNFLFAGNEQALLQDRLEICTEVKTVPAPNVDGSIAASIQVGRPQKTCHRERDSIRILKMKRADDNFSFDSQYRYQVEEGPDNGVSEMLALSDSAVLVLERGFDSVTQKVTARVFLVRLDTNKAFSDATGIAKAAVLEKKLVLDFNDLLPGLAPGLRRIDNLEAMAFGPHAANGRKTIIFASDNNFSGQQRTQILLFEIGSELAALVQ